MDWPSKPALRIRCSPSHESKAGSGLELQPVKSFMARFLIIVLSLSLTLAGCKVGPDYHPPSTAVDGSFEPLPGKASAQPYALTSSSSETAEWWTTLNDPVLNSLIEQAVKANHDLRLAAARVREARARRAVVGAGQYPSMDVNAAYSRNRFSKTAAPYNAFDVPGFPWGFDLYQAGFDASWELDVFGAVRRSVEAANAGLEASMEDRRSVLVSVVGGGGAQLRRASRVPAAIRDQRPQPPDAASDARSDRGPNS